MQALTLQYIKLQELSNVTTRLIAELQIRDRKGFAKYGTTLDRTDLTPLQWLQHAKEEALDFACYLEKLIVLEQSGENAPLSTPNSPISNAEELSTKENGQTAYDLLAASLLAQHQAFEAHEIRRIWMTLYQLENGSTLCKIVKNAIETAQGIEALNPHGGDPVEKLNAIKVVGKGGVDALKTLFEACGHKVKVVEATGHAKTKKPA